MILPSCATCSSPRLKQSPARILPLKTLLPVLVFNLALTLTLLHLPSHFPALVNQNFVVLPRWALWDHPEQKQTILQTPISSPHPTRRAITAQNATSRISKREKILAVKIATCTSITAGIHSQYFF